MGSLWNRSGTVERYADDLRAAGAKAYFFRGGTTTSFTVYADSGEASAHPQPVVADANGRWPDVFVPFIASYDVRVTSADDVQLTFSLQIPNVGPSEGGDVIIDPEESVQTGMIHAEFVNTTRAGYVRLNNRTMGNAASGGTERANADTENLFAYLWNNTFADSVPVFSGGVEVAKGLSAAADFAANRAILLPGCRGTMLIGLDDMGNTAAGNFGSLTFANGNASGPASFIGDNNPTQFAGLDFVNVQSFTSSATAVVNGFRANNSASGIWNNIPNARLVTWFIKL